MYSVPSAPRTIGGVLDDTFKLFRVSIGKCWPISLASSILSILPGLFMLSYVDNPAQLAELVLTGTFWVLYVLLLGASIAFYVALLVRTWQVAQGETESSVASAFFAGMRLLPRSLLASLLYFLVVFGGMLLLIVPGLILMVSLLLSGVVIVTENRRATESLGRSRELVKGNWWRTSALTFMAFVLAYVLYFCAEIIGQGFALSGAADPTLSAMWTTVVTGALNVFVLPLYSSALLSIYLDLRLRKEGDDLSQRIESLA